jgi:hypothetical protein
MKLEDLIEQVDNFDTLAPRHKIRLFAWWLHTHKGAETFDSNAIRACYTQLHIPADKLSVYIPQYGET